GEKLGVELTDTRNIYNPVALYNLSRAKCADFTEIWRKTHRIHVRPYYELVHIVNEYVKFKKREGLLDFTDMILKYIKQGAPLPVSVAFIDEAQDLSAIQWKMIEKAFANAE